METSNWNPATLLKLSGSYWETCTLHACVKLDLFTQLADGPSAATELSKKLDLDVRGFTILLDALVALQLLKQQGDMWVQGGLTWWQWAICTVTDKIYFRFQAEKIPAALAV